MEHAKVSESLDTAESTAWLQRLTEAVGPTGVLTGDQISAALAQHGVRDRTNLRMEVVRPACTNKETQVGSVCLKAAFGIVMTVEPTSLFDAAQHLNIGCFINATHRMSKIHYLFPDNLTRLVDARVFLEPSQIALSERGLDFGVAIRTQSSSQIDGSVSTIARRERVLCQDIVAARTLGLEPVFADVSAVSLISELNNENWGSVPLRLAIAGKGVFIIIKTACLCVLSLWQCAATAHIGCAFFLDVLALLHYRRGAAHEGLLVFQVMFLSCWPLAKRVDTTMTPPLNVPALVLRRFCSTMDLLLHSMLEKERATAIDHASTLDAVVAKSEAQATRLWASCEVLVEGRSRRDHHVSSDVSLRIGQLSETTSEFEAKLEAEYPGWIAQSYGHMSEGNPRLNALSPEAMTETESRKTGKRIEHEFYDVVLKRDGSYPTEHGIGRKKANWFRETKATRLDLLSRFETATGSVTNRGCLLSHESNLR